MGLKLDVGVIGLHAQTRVGGLGKQLHHLGAAHTGGIVHRSVAMGAWTMTRSGACHQVGPPHTARTVEPLQRMAIIGVELPGMRIEAQGGAVGGCVVHREVSGG